MSKARNISNLFSSATDLATDAEVTAAIASKANLTENTFTAAQIIQPSAAQVPLTLRSSSSGSSNLLNILNSSGTSIGAISTSGELAVGSSNFSGGSNRLVVSGNAMINAGTDITPDSNGSGHLRIGGNGYTGFATLDGTAMWIGHNSSARDLIFATDETTRMRIDGSGNISLATNQQKVLIGASDHASTAAPLSIRKPIDSGASTNYAIIINDPNTNTAGGTNLIGFSHNNNDYSTANVRAAMGATIDGSGNGSLVFRSGPYQNQSEGMRLDHNGNLGIGNTSPSAYNSSGGKVLNITAPTLNSGPATINQGRAGAGYAATEVFALGNITSSQEITRVTGTNANGFRAYFKVVVTGHTGNVNNGINIKEFYWDGGTNAPVQISTYTANNVPPITFDTTVSNRLVVLLASSNGSAGFNGVMKIEWMLPIDFASSVYTLS